MTPTYSPQQPPPLIPRNLNLDAFQPNLSGRYSEASEQKCHYVFRSKRCYRCALRLYLSYLAVLVLVFGSLQFSRGKRANTYEELLMLMHFGARRVWAPTSSRMERSAETKSVSASSFRLGGGILEVPVQIKSSTRLSLTFIYRLRQITDNIVCQPASSARRRRAQSLDSYETSEIMKLNNCQSFIDICRDDGSDTCKE